MVRSNSPKLVLNDLTNEQLEAVRLRAFELFETRGREDGHALEDWLQAKEEVLVEVLAAAA